MRWMLTLAVLAVLAGLQVAATALELRKPRIEVYKAKRELRLFDDATLVKTYPVALGSNPVPPKERQGDRATPEGTYTICQKNPRSQYHLSLGISYPGRHDAERGFKAKLISAAERQAILAAAARGKAPPWNTRLGGEVFVHGNGSKPDWTWGCIALDDKDIEELYHAVPIGTAITIHP
ncbi:MAG: L,D-transpeptidase [Verrucomicrobia bacterium]|nr:L,D-transpeptidase [Verrucomicrobiota bacterium]